MIMKQKLILSTLCASLLAMSTANATKHARDNDDGAPQQKRSRISVEPSSPKTIADIDPNLLAAQFAVHLGTEDLLILAQTSHSMKDIGEQAIIVATKLEQKEKRRAAWKAAQGELGAFTPIRDVFIVGQVSQFLSSQDLIQLQTVNTILREIAKNTLKARHKSQKTSVFDTEELDIYMGSIIYRTGTCSDRTCVMRNLENSGRLIERAIPLLESQPDFIKKIFFEKMKENAENDDLIKQGYGAEIYIRYLENQINEEDTLAYLAFGDVFFKNLSKESGEVSTWLDFLKSSADHRNIIPLVRYGKRLITDEMTGAHNTEILCDLADKYNGQVGLTDKYRTHVTKIIDSGAIEYIDSFIADIPEENLRSFKFTGGKPSPEDIKTIILKIFFSLDVDKIEGFIDNAKRNIYNLKKDQYPFDSLRKIAAGTYVPPLSELSYDDIVFIFEEI